MFWKHLQDPYAPTTYKEVANVYKAFPVKLNRFDLHQLYFWYKYESHRKKPNPEVTPAEIIAIFRASRGVENTIAYYFQLRLDKKKPLKECKVALLNKIKGVSQEDQDKKIRKELAEKEKAGKKPAGKKEPGKEEKKDTKKEDKKEEKRDEGKKPDKPTTGGDDVLKIE